MTKPNFLKLFEYDSGTEENCQKTVMLYRRAAYDAIENAGKVVLSVSQENPNVTLDWKFNPKKRIHNGASLKIPPAPAH